MEGLSWRRALLHVGDGDVEGHLLAAVVRGTDADEEEDHKDANHVQQGPSTTDHVLLF